MTALPSSTGSSRFLVFLWLRSAPLHNALFALFLGGILTYGAAFAWYVLDRLDLFSLLQFYYDDAFYYLQTAWHMAQGNFSTFDGGITRSNGYHPMWLFLITPFYWVFDKVEALFAIKAFEVMLVAGGVALVAGAARVARLPWILLFGVLPTVYQRSNPLLAGLEAAAGLFMLGAFFLTVCLYARDPAKWRLTLAVVAFALPWVRLEYAAISLAATGALCLLEWSWRDPSARRALALLRVRAGVPFLAGGGGLLVYFAYNAVVFGGVLPVSAATKRWWSERRWELEEGYSLAGNFDAMLQHPRFDDEVPLALVLCGLLVLVWRCARRKRIREDWLLLAFLVGVFSLAAGHLAKFAQSVLIAHPRDPLLKDWHFVQAYLMEALAVPTLCYVALYLIRRFLGPGPCSGARPRGAYRISAGMIFLAGTFFLFVKADFGHPYRLVDSRNEAVGGRAVLAHIYLGTMVMNRLLPEGSVVGSWGSGIIGYFSRFPVVNLDGLINSYGYLRARKEGAVATFLTRFGLSHMADANPHHARGRLLLFESVPLDMDRWKHEGARRRFRLWPVEPPGGGIDRSEWFWERMEPHLERQAGGIGLLVDGRMAQAFARDCTPNAPVTWTWGGAGQEETVFTSWTKSSIGFCTSVVVLPHDALPSVRAAAMTVDEYLAHRVGERLPAIRSGFDVYLVENRLVYVKEPCGQDAVEARFFLHVVPVVPDDLPDHRRKHGFDNLDFWFYERGWRIGEGTCQAEVPLPEYGIAAIRTGQSLAEEDGWTQLWGEDIRFE